MRRLLIGALVTSAALTGCTCSSPAPKAEVPAATPAAEATPARPKGVVELANPDAVPTSFRKLRDSAPTPVVELDPETARWAREREAIANTFLKRGEVTEARKHFEMIIDRTPPGSRQYEAAKRALEQAPH